jgi:hypothetical protein
MICLPIEKNVLLVLGGARSAIDAAQIANA